ncbi:hypothetical protein [Microbacterium sp. CIAB417]|uniref:hypothetical protein n=1 Tax=Microbacterium sp. CIAB417 TaxID=2860287 RepID=UPI001FAE494B|nr:hypothetical protein [Microbacterium sp. CIAB417]
MDDRAHQPAHRARRRSATDPTLVRNQPALRSSDGTIWIVVAGGFALACAVPLVLILVDPGPSAVVAWTTAVLMVVLYAALVAARFLIADRVQRLRVLAVLMLVMAAVALLGLLACVLIEWSTVPRV